MPDINTQGSQTVLPYHLQKKTGQSGEIPVIITKIISLKWTNDPVLFFRDFLDSWFGSKSLKW